MRLCKQTCRPHRSTNSLYLYTIIINKHYFVQHSNFFLTMSSKFWAELSSDYEKLFEEELGYDVIIYAGEEQNVKEIHAHSNILSIRSKYFSTAFSNEWTEKNDGNFIFRKPNISPHLFNIILR